MWADLVRHSQECTLVYWHHPRFTSGNEGPVPKLQPLWEDLVRAGVEVLLTGHDHDYERFRMQAIDGSSDPSGGVREWVVGTGGKNLGTFPHPQPGAVIRNDTTFGVLRMTLRPEGYDWRFEPEGSGTFTDSGTGTCH